MVIRSLEVNRNEMNSIEGNFEKRNQGCFIVADLWGYVTCWSKFLREFDSFLSSIDCRMTLTIFFYLNVHFFNNSSL